ERGRRSCDLDVVDTVFGDSTVDEDTDLDLDVVAGGRAVVDDAATRRHEEDAVGGRHGRAQARHERRVHVADGDSACAVDGHAGLTRRASSTRCTRGAGRAISAGRTLRASVTLRASGAGVALCAGRALRTLCAGRALRTLCAGRALRTLCTGRALRTSWTHRAGRPLRTSRALRAGRSSVASRTSRTHCAGAGRQDHELLLALAGLAGRDRTQAAAGVDADAECRVRLRYEGAPPIRYTRQREEGKDENADSDDA